MLKKLNTFYHLNWQRKSLLFQAFWLSVYAYFMMKFFKKYARFGSHASEGRTFFSPFPIGEGSVVGLSPSGAVGAIRWAIFVVNKYIPWENVCRHQAFQAMLLCKKYGIPYQIFVGFKKNTETGKIDGHAWTIADNQLITGFCNPAEYTVQAVYEG